MPRHPSPLPPSLPHAVFTTSEARLAGVSIDRLRAKDLTRLGYGIYARTDASLTEAEILSAITRHDPLVVARGLSAARYWKLPLPMRRQKWEPAPRMTPIHLTADGLVHRDTKLLRWNRQRPRPEEIVTISDLRVTNRVRTWLDLAQELSLEQLVKIGDHLVRIPRTWAEDRHEPFATPAQLRASVRAYPGPHRPLLRQALELIRVGSDSPAETTLRLAAGRAGLPVTTLNVRQFEGDLDLGEPDLSWPEWKVCVEHDGPAHRTPEQQERDIRRRERREAHGWIEVQTVAVDLYDGCQRGVRRMTEALTKHGWRPTTDSSPQAPRQRRPAPRSTPILATPPVPRIGATHASGAKMGE